MKNIDLHSIISSESFWQVNKKIARYFKDNNTAILLEDLVSKKKYFESKNQVDVDGYFFNTSENIEEDCNLSYHKQKGCLKQLKEAGFIDTKLKGVPAKLHFKIFENQILNFLKTRIENFSKQDLELFELNNNKINNNKNKTKDNKIVSDAKATDFLENHPPDLFIEIWNRYDGKKKDLQTEWGKFYNAINYNPDYELMLSRLNKGNKQAFQSWLNKYKTEPSQTKKIIIEEYINFYKNRIGSSPIINPIEAQASERLAKYFEKAVKEKKPDTYFTTDLLEMEVRKSIKIIFDLWENVDGFYKKQIKLAQIETNLPNIINSVKQKINEQRNQQISNAQRYDPFKR